MSDVNMNLEIAAATVAQKWRDMGCAYIGESESNDLGDLLDNLVTAVNHYQERGGALVELENELLIATQRKTWLRMSEVLQRRVESGTDEIKKLQLRVTELESGRPHPAPDRYYTDDNCHQPVWVNVPFVGMIVTAWREGLETDLAGLCDCTPEQLDHASGVLAAAAKWMREHPTGGPK